VAIVGLWAGGLRIPRRQTLAKKAGMSLHKPQRRIYRNGDSFSRNNLGLPWRFPDWRNVSDEEDSGVYFAGMLACISLSFGGRFICRMGWDRSSRVYFFGFFGGNFALFSLWLPEQYERQFAQRPSHSQLPWPLYRAASIF